MYHASNGACRETLYNICGHRDTYCDRLPGSAHRADAARRSAPRSRRALSGAGYWIASELGQVLPFGGVAVRQRSARTAAAASHGIAGHPTGAGYWLSAATAACTRSATRSSYGSMNGRRLTAPIVGMAPTPTGNGYWLVGQRRRRVLVRRREVLRLDRRPAPERAGARHHCRPRPARATGSTPATAASSAFGDAQVLRVDRQHPAQPAGRRRWPRGRRATATGWSPPTAASSRSARRRSRVRARAHATYSPCVAMLADHDGQGLRPVAARRFDARRSATRPNLGNGCGQVGAAAIGIAGRLKPI